MKVKLTDIEKLSVLPYRQKFGQFISTKLECYTYTSWYDRRDFFNSDFLRKVKKTILGSVGLHIDDVLSKVSKMLPNNCPYSNHYILERYIDYDERQYLNKKKWYHDGIYINKEGYLKRCKSNKLHQTTRHNTEWSKIHKITKERDNIVSTTLIKLINKPLLFQFYKELLFKVIELNKNVIDYTKYYKEKKQNGKRTYSSGYYWKRLFLKYKAELEQVRNDISKIENGEYNIFYESNVYLYSLQKECPHFESPIKQKEDGKN